LPKRSPIVSLLLLAVPVALAAQDNGIFEFVENKGQWDSRVRFRSEITTGAFFLRSDGFTVVQHHPDDLQQFNDHSHGMLAERGKGADPEKTGHEITEITGDSRSNRQLRLRSHAYSVTFLGAATNPEIVPDKIQAHYNNYFLGDDPTHWAGEVRIYGGVTYKNIYPGIDLRYYGEGGYLKYDFIIHPGAKTERIALKYEGVDELKTNRSNELLIRTSVAENKELAPYAYQYLRGSGRKKVDCKYVIDAGNLLRFSVKGHDPNETLVIDPLVIFSTFSGGPNNYGFTATPGPDGSLFAGGIIFSTGFPTSSGAFQRNFQGGDGQGACDMIIIKFNGSGSQRVYSTYLGGSNNDFPHSLYSDPQGQLVIMGRSYSPNYPTTVPAVGTGLGCNIVVSKLNATGAALIGSMKIGGSANDGVNINDNYNTGSLIRNSLLQNYGDESRSEVVMDRAGNIYVAGNTFSGDFPVFHDECNPFAYIVEQAGGKATDGSGRILDIKPTELHQRTPLFIGSRMMMEELESYTNA